MFLFQMFFMHSLIMFILDMYAQEIGEQDFQIVSRTEWNATPAFFTSSMSNPVPHVIIHHSYRPKACGSFQQCSEAMRSMQNFHIEERGWADIGYNFAVGGDGRAYEGRGWTAIGAHAPNYNHNSIGICLIGDWRENLPPENQLDAVKDLIEYGIENRFIQKNYILYGHRQVRGTECPGDALYEEIQTWPHYSKVVKS